MGLILTPVIILACLLKADSHVTTTHLTKGQRKERERRDERDMETAIQPCPSVSLLILVVSDSDITSAVTRFHHHSSNRHWHSATPLLSSPLLSFHLHSLFFIDDHLFLSLLKFPTPFISHSLDLTSSATLSTHMLSHYHSILKYCLPPYMSICVCLPVYTGIVDR